MFSIDFLMEEIELEMSQRKFRISNEGNTNSTSWNIWNVTGPKHGSKQMVLQMNYPVQTENAQ